MNLAKILWAAGERDEAAKCLRRIVQAFPNDVASRGLLAQYYIEKSDPLGAIGPLEQALEQSSVPAELRDRLKDMLATAYLQGAGIETQKTQLEPALAFYEKAERLLPNELNVYLGKAGVLVQLKQFANAAQTLEKMAALQPENPTIVLSLGDVRYQNGEAAEAQRRWQQALQLTPANDLELRKVLEIGSPAAFPRTTLSDPAFRSGSGIDLRPLRVFIIYLDGKQTIHARNWLAPAAVCGPALRLFSPPLGCAEKTLSIKERKPMDFDAFTHRGIGNPAEGQPWISDLLIVDLDGDGLKDVLVCDGRLNKVSWIRQVSLGCLKNNKSGRQSRVPRMWKSRISMATDTSTSWSRRWERSHRAMPKRVQWWCS